MLRAGKSKYIKPRSLSWWSSLAPLAGGLVVALSPIIPPLVPLAMVVNHLSGGMEPAVLINIGLLGIGLRGSVPDR